VRLRHWLQTLPLRLRSLFRRQQVERELDEELQYHLEQKTEEYIAHGLSPEDARYAALRAMDGLEQKKEECRDMRRTNLIEIFIQNVRYGLRMLRKNPGFTAAAALTLALGIGATTAVFSVANALFFEPLPSVRDFGRLVTIRETLPDGSCCNVPTANYLDMTRDSRPFSGLAAYAWNRQTLTIGGLPEAITGVKVSEGFFKLFGAHPILGRDFLPEELRSERPVAILSYAFWRERLGGDPAIVGKSVPLDGIEYTVVGVVGKEFEFPPATDVWTPLVFTGADAASRSPGRLHVMAQLAPSVKIEQAQSEMDVLSNRLEKEYPKTEGRSKIYVLSLRENINGNLTPMFTMTLLGAAGFFLLIACSNVANLQLARADSRKQEMAIRATLGAGRARITLQLLTESLFLALLGGGLGLLLARVGIAAISAGFPPEVSRKISGADNIQLNGSVLLFAGAVTLLVAVFSGLTPALHSARRGLSEVLKSSRTKASAGRGSRRLRSAFVGAQLSLAMILLIGAGLMVRGFNAVLGEAKTFGPDTLLTMHVNLLDGRYKDPHNRAVFYEQALAKLAALPGATYACVFTGPPFSNNEVVWWDFSVGGRDASSRGRGAIVQNVSPDYFHSTKIPFLEGRMFTPQDAENSMPTAIVSRNLAHSYWPNGTAVGQHLKLGLRDSKNSWLTIVGVAADVEYDWTTNSHEPAIYLPYRQSPAASSYLAIRTAGNPQTLIGSIRREMATLDSGLPVTDIKTLSAVMASSMSPLLEIGGLMTTLGLIGLVVSVIGAYGVAAWSAGQRMQEIGIRIAFGAKPRDVLRLILSQGMLVAGIGSAIGAVGALFLTRIISGFFYGVSPNDPATFVTIALVLTGAALMACFIPARRATRVDPMVTLRYE
jgi:putative ABC transport system permease protein